MGGYAHDILRRLRRRIASVRRALGVVVSSTVLAAAVAPLVDGVARRVAAVCAGVGLVVTIVVSLALLRLRAHERMLASALSEPDARPPRRQ